jgi:hypothetical protein
MMMKLKLLFGAALLTTAMSANAILAVPTCPNLQVAKAEYAAVAHVYTKKALREMLIYFISCGLDPTKIVPPAAFGGFSSFPGVMPVPQSLGGDPVSPS